jgi:hypothetical protein
MKNTYKILFLLYFLLTDFMLFAQPGDDDTNGENGLEGGDPTVAPINTKLWLLLLFAIIFAYRQFTKKNSLKEKTNY